ncbi:MAG: sulfatase [Planctomycetota bacterium]
MVEPMVERVRVFTGWLTGLCVGVAALVVAAEPADRPNVLFIAVDDLKPAIGVFGDPVAQTPHMDRLAARGTAFINAHCQQAVCAPSRVSLLTGLRPDATRVWDLKTRFREHLPDVVTLPQRFKRVGYASVGMGKIFDFRSVEDPQTMDPISWTEPFEGVPAPANQTFSYRNPEIVRHIEHALAEAEDPPTGWSERLKLIFPDGQPAFERADVPDSEYQDGAMTDLAVERLAGFAASGEPFFLAVGFKKPHLPFNAPERYWRMYDRDALPLAEFTRAPGGAPDYAPQPGWELRFVYDVPKTGPIPLDLQRDLVHGYYATTSFIDAQVGRLLDALDEHGLADDTVVVLWGDHGFHLGDHAIWCKHTNYEQATRSPLIVVAPGIGVPGGVSDAPVDLLDVYPTLMDLVGLEPAGELHGVSLRPILHDPSARVKALATSQYPRGSETGPLMGYAYRSERYRLVQWRRLAERGAAEIAGSVVATELYDYAADPLETRNLVDDPAYADVLVEMRTLAAAHRDATLP